MVRKICWKFSRSWLQMKQALWHRTERKNILKSALGAHSKNKSYSGSNVNSSYQKPLHWAILNTLPTLWTRFKINWNLVDPSQRGILNWIGSFHYWWNTPDNDVTFRTTNVGQSCAQRYLESWIILFLHRECSWSRIPVETYHQLCIKRNEFCCEDRW